MKNLILDRIKVALKEDGDTEIIIPLSGNYQYYKCQSNFPNTSLNNVKTSNKQIELSQKTDPIINDSKQSDPVPCKNDKPNDDVALNQANPVAENQYPSQTVPQPINFFEEMARETHKLKTINRYNIEREKIYTTLSKHNDEQNIIYKRNQLAYIQPTPLNDDVNVDIRFPIHFLPKEYQDLVKAISHALNVPVESVVPALLGAIFTAGRGQFKIKVKEGYFESFTEYIIVVQHSGENKSAIVQSFRSVFDRKEAKLQEEFDLNLPNQKLILEAYKNSKKKIMKSLIKGVDITDPMKINAQYRRVADMLAPLEREIAKINYKPRYFNDSPTLQKLAQNMEQQNEVLSIFEAEGGIWKHRVRPNEDTILLKAYTMEPFSTETITNGSVTMACPVLTICSYIQPSVAEKVFSKEDLHDDGLLPRILPVFIPRGQSVKNADPLEVPPHLNKMNDNKFFKLLQHSDLKVNDETKRPIYTLNLTDEAYTVFVDYKQTINEQLSDGKFNNCEAFASKLAGHAVRLAAAVHFLQHEEPWDQRIDSSAMEAGIAIANFFAAHVKSFFDRERHEAIEFAKKILKKIKKRKLKDSFTQRVAQRAVGHCDSTQINSALNLLEKHHYLASHTDFTNKTTFIINPNILNEGFGCLSWPNQSPF